MWGTETIYDVRANDVDQSEFINKRMNDWMRT